MQWKSGSTENLPAVQYGHGRPASLKVSTNRLDPQLGHASAGARESTARMSQTRRGLADELANV
jgi:hypothetical protein